MADGAPMRRKLDQVIHCYSRAAVHARTTRGTGQLLAGTVRRGIILCQSFTVHCPSSLLTDASDGVHVYPASSCLHPAPPHGARARAATAARARGAARGGNKTQNTAGLAQSAQKITTPRQTHLRPPVIPSRLTSHHRTHPAASRGNAATPWRNEPSSPGSPGSVTRRRWHGAARSAQTVDRVQ